MHKQCVAIPRHFSRRASFLLNVFAALGERAAGAELLARHAAVVRDVESWFRREQRQGRGPGRPTSTEILASIAESLDRLVAVQQVQLVVLRWQN